jgi:DNA-binding beta-propeller fold protein YncE
MPRTTSSPQPADAISTYRDALMRDASPQELRELGAGIDPDLVAWLDLFRTAQREPVHLDPAFADRLDRVIASVPGPGQVAATPLPGRPLRLSRSHAVPVPRPPATFAPPAPTSQPRPRVDPRRLLSSLISGAILAAILIAGLYAFGPLRPQPPAQMIAAPDAPVHLEPVWDVPGGGTLIVAGYGVGVDPDGNVWVADLEDRFHIVSPDGAAREVWGERGSAPGQFDFHSIDASVVRDYGDVAFAADGTIYVADTGNHRIQVFAPDRTYLSEWGGEGTGDGQFLAPSGIAVAPDGTIYVSDEGRDDVQRFDQNGRFLGAFGESGVNEGQFMTPAGVGVAGSGEVYVADYGRQRIQRFTADGTFLGAWGKSGDGNGQFNNPNDVAVDRDGRVYVADDFNNLLQVFTPDGRFLAQIGGYGDGLGLLDDPLGVATGPDGMVYVGDRDGIQAFRLVPGAAP